MNSRCLARDELERLHAGELSPERAAAVEGHLRECATCRRIDVELREEHEAMLADLGGLPPTAPHSAEHDRETATVGSSAGEATSLIGQRIGSYTIQGVIGEGGMGAVYKAQQDRPRQMVALKVIRGGLPSPREMRRFEFESEVLGHLQHIGIARIYQAGLFETRFGQQPYFAMELIDGQPLTAFANKTGLGTRQRLELLARVADAVQHAHSNGVMHLDLKPGNILVTADGQPKVVDFGLARLAPGQQPPALAGLPLTAILGGTPAYMSPEQAGGDPRDVDARSDVYSLGVVAYELLTGRLPYASLNSSDRRIGPNDVFRIVREEEPTRLTRATRWDGSSARTFAGDVEAIVHKALDKDKERRYATAAAMAADIRRHLSDQPIAARPASAMYQLRKFARRNRALVGGVAATIVVLVAGLVGTGLALARAVAAEHEQARQRANAELVADEMAAMLEGVKVSVALGRDTTMLREMLDKVAERIEEGKLKDSPEAELRLRWTIGSAYVGIAADGAAQRAETILLPTLELAERAYGAESAEEAESLSTVAACLNYLGRPADALSKYEAALEMRQRLFNGDHPDVATSLNNLATCLQSLGRSPEALPRLEAALEMNQRLFKGDHPDVAISLGNVGYCLYSLGRSAEALPRFEAALGMKQRLFKGDHPDVAASVNGVANCLSSLGRPVEALPEYKAALEMFQHVLPAGHPNVLYPQIGVARSLVALGRFVEAEPLLIDATAQCDRSAASRRMHWLGVLEASAHLYDAWHAAEPDKGYDAKAAQWRAKLEAWQASTQPSSSEERGASNEFLHHSLDSRRTE